MDEEKRKRKQLCDKIYYMARKKKSFLEICQSLKLKDYEVAGLISLMSQEGYNIEFVNGEALVLSSPKKRQDVY